MSAGVCAVVVGGLLYGEQTPRPKVVNSNCNTPTAHAPSLYTAGSDRRTRLESAPPGQAVEKWAKLPL